jgi:hypothetical protein
METTIFREAFLKITKNSDCPRVFLTVKNFCVMEVKQDDGSSVGIGLSWNYKRLGLFDVDLSIPLNQNERFKFRKLLSIKNLEENGFSTKSSFNSHI